MANVDISTELAAIMTAIYGEEVRGSIHDALERMAQIVNENVVTIDDTFSVQGAAADAKKVGDTALLFNGTLEDGSNLNNVKSQGVYKLVSSRDYTNCPSDAGTRWLVVYSWGTSGVTVTQQLIETGVADQTYYTWTRHCNSSNVWGGWQKNRSDTDDTFTLEGIPADSKAVGDTTLRKMGVLPGNTDFNNVTETGIYRLSSSSVYLNMPSAMSTTTGWLIVYSYGSTGISLTQTVFETGTSATRIYHTYMRSANTTTSPYNWGTWQDSTVDTDDTLTVTGMAADAKTVGDRFADLEYEPIDIYSVSCSPSEAELGSTVNQVAISYSINKVPTSLVIGGNSVTPAASGTYTMTSLNLVSSTNWTVSASDSGSPSNPPTTDTMSGGITFKNKIYWGVAAQPGTINSQFILESLQNSQLATSRAKTFTVTAGSNQYIWFVSPQSFGACSFKVGGFDGGFTRVSTLSHTNASGATYAYYVYKSDNVNLGSTTVTVS